MSAARSFMLRLEAVHMVKGQPIYASMPSEILTLKAA
jgi:hypothetical protein